MSEQPRAPDRDPAVGIAWHDDHWIGVALDPADSGVDRAGADRTGDVEATVADSIGSLWASYGEDASVVLAGVPIGLVEDGGPERACDDLARSALGPRADAVVTPPVREATRRRRYPAARRVHERRSGADLSEAAFGLAAPIASLDELLQEVSEARETIRSSHPELAFRGLAGESLDHPPETAGGYAERMRTLAEHDPDAPPTVQATAEAVAGADVPVHALLDAVALAYTARGSRESPEGSVALRSLPANPPTDPTGLPMELVYRAAEPLAPETADPD